MATHRSNASSLGTISRATRSNSTASSTTRHGKSPSRTPPRYGDGITPPQWRVSKRHRCGSFDSVDTSLSSHTAGGDDSYLRLLTPTPAPTRALTNPRENVEYCIEFGLPSKLCCSGYDIFAQSQDLPLNLDSVEPEHVMAINVALTTRHKFKGRDTKCRQLWKLEESDLSMKKDKELHLKQLPFIQHDLVVLVASRPPTPVVAAPTPSPTPFVAPSPSPATIPEEFPLLTNQFL
jgi:hypothetical protein